MDVANKPHKVDIPRLGYHSHSNTLIVDEGGNKLDMFLEGACYAHLRSGVRKDTRLFLLFPKHPCPSTKECVSWVIRSELFGEAFLTKNFDEGMKWGFEIDVSKPTNFIFSAMAAIRMPWEAFNSYDCWDYRKFRELGFLVKESFYLAQNCIIIGGGCIKPSPYNSNHIPVSRSVPFTSWSSKNFSRQEGAMNEGSQCASVTGSWKFEGMGTGDLFKLVIGAEDNNFGVTIPKKLDEQTVYNLKTFLRGE